MTDENNGKVTLAVLANKIDNLTEQVNRLSAIGTTAQANQLAIGKLEIEQKNQCKDIEDLSTRVNGWSVLNSAGVILAAIIGIFVNPKS